MSVQVVRESAMSVKWHKGNECSSGARQRTECSSGATNSEMSVQWCTTAKEVQWCTKAKSVFKVNEQRMSVQW
jgi:hypothetical protein